MSRLQRSILPLLILAVAAPLRAADRQQMASLLENLYKGQNMALRTSTSGATVRYSADGRLINGGEPGPWTLDTDIQCTGVELKRNDLVIKGKRLYFVYEEKLEKLRPYFGPPVRVEIDTRGEPLSLSTLQQDIANVFVTGSDNPELLVPDYWKDYLLSPTQKVITPPQQQMSAVPLSSMEKLTGETGKQASPMSSVYNIELSASPGEKRKVTPGRLIYKEAPPYTPEARMAGIEGTVMLSVMVDARGRVAKESIIRPLGLGLDDSCAQSVQRWRFEPATIDGKPVPVHFTLQFNFRLR